MSASVRDFLTFNGFDPAAGVRHLLPPAVGGSVRYLFTHNDRLLPNQQLNRYGQLVSNSRLFNLIMQNDGDLALYRTHFSRMLWASNTSGVPADHVIMQADGNLVAYSAGDVSHWETGTAGHPGAMVVLQDDGNAVVYDAAGSPQWASNTVQDLSSTTIQYADASGYQYDETSESWKQTCTAFPCFAALQWPGYSTLVVDGEVIDGQPIVIQLWKGTCQKLFKGLPGGIGAEVGVYRRMPGRARPTSLPFLPRAVASAILQAISRLSDDELWWPFPELGTMIEFTLTNPSTGEPFFSAGPELTYWQNKWMDSGSYAQYGEDQQGQIPSSPTGYVLNYRINGKSYPAW
jgi:hypothetical protein